VNNKRTPERRALILDDCRRGLSLKAAAAAAGITREAVRLWAKDDPAFGEELEVARGEGQRALELLALSPDVTGPAANVLRHRLGCIDVEEWGERKVDVPAGATLADLMRADANSG
jgi:hypothetical protein